MHTKAKFSPKKCTFYSLLLIKRAKIDQFEKTQGVLESSFYGLFDGAFRFEKFFIGFFIGLYVDLENLWLPYLWRTSGPLLTIAQQYGMLDI